VCPRYKHGTTRSRPGSIIRQGIAINFSTHIKEAFDIAVKAGGFVLKNGGGDEDGESDPRSEPGSPKENGENY